MPSDNMVRAPQWHSHIILFTGAIRLHVATNSNATAHSDVLLWSFLDTELCGPALNLVYIYSIPVAMCVILGSCLIIATTCMMQHAYYIPCIKLYMQCVPLDERIACIVYVYESLHVCV